MAVARVHTAETARNGTSTHSGDMIDALYGTGPYAQAATDLR